MNIVSGVTGKVVGAMDREGTVTTRISELRAIVATVEARGYVVIPDRSVVEDGVIAEEVAVVHNTDPDYVRALCIYLLREGYEVAGEL